MKGERAVRAFGLIAPGDGEGFGLQPFAARTEIGLWDSLAGMFGQADVGAFAAMLRARGFRIVPVEIRPLPEDTGRE